ncbi:neuropilin and tolloid-like protein 1 [Trichonephila clavata]|uniref:Neuropilin and tolloid-like protein 1 n=1 Tax=Trichonephila clavata TaxID=2740835 RepID=A0A8X6GER3_TRICU|nr:neuropilin and tolloid-like protein 1 [Trichonephila clavata]
MSSGAKQKVESASLMELSEDSACYNFSVGNPQKREFYSPNYPNIYPKNVKCTLRIIADPGHTVRLDFRDKFHLENSPSCSYDWLEVRDGPHGYSPVIGGRYCGNEFPKQMLSSKRFMWVQFSSDDSIEYEGFRAVYDFVKVPNTGSSADIEKECSFYRSGHSGIIKKEEMDTYWLKYRNEDVIECMWTIETEPGKKLYLNFKEFGLDRPNDCDQNFLQIFPDSRTPSEQVIQFCGTTAEPQRSTANISYVRLFTQRDAYNKTDFKIHFTSFREIKKEDSNVSPLDPPETDRESHGHMPSSIWATGTRFERKQFADDDDFQHEVLLRMTQHHKEFYSAVIGAPIKRWESARTS